jgi:hypothetical protein
MVRGGWVRRGTWSPRFSLGNRAPGRICGQAIAQIHQGPQGLRVQRALALLPHEAPNSLRQQYLRFDQSASIIAPGREGSQLGGADAYLGARLFCKIGVCYSSCTTLEIEQ